jgi:predicted ATP-dependent endonuclease of OLD family
MKYKKFIIQNYRAVKKPLEINVERDKLIPIIGLNESGKTTVLHAIAAFDHYIDNYHDGMHLNDVDNLYEINPPDPKIIAIVQTSFTDVIDALNVIKGKAPEATARLLEKINQDKNSIPSEITITRNLKNKQYSLDWEDARGSELENLLGTELIRFLPWLLYFDDFRDKVSDEIEIVETETSEWLDIIERLFKKTNPDYSVKQVVSLEPRKRKALLSEVENELNKTLTSQWQNFQLDNSDALTIKIDYTTKNVSDSVRNYLRFEVVEQDLQGREKFFYLSNRSKGFYWFFNFVMKLEFNPKSMGEDNQRAIYLLDEPGSYLHAFAQTKLCQKLKDLSKDNNVIYCTHSHYLLDPGVIPFGNIKIADKTESGVELSSVNSFSGEIVSKHSPFQVVMDALHVSPSVFDFSNKLILLVEGIADYYAFEMFKSNNQVAVFPCTGADSIKYWVSLMLAFKVNFRCLWDNDSNGQASFGDAEEHFGREVSDKHFFLLPKAASHKKRILQDLFTSEDMKLIREELGLPQNSSFEKKLINLYYSTQRNSILAKISPETRSRFDEVFKTLGYK